jgi:hypothetical protein
MWLFLTRRLRQWAIFAILVPLVATLVHAIRVRLEARTGPTRLTKVLRTIEGFGQSGRRRGRRGRKG